MHECKQKCSRVDDDGILFVDGLEVLGDGCERVYEDRGHHLGKGEEEDD